MGLSLVDMASRGKKAERNADRSRRGRVDPQRTASSGRVQRTRAPQRIDPVRSASSGRPRGRQATPRGTPRIDPVQAASRGRVSRRSSKPQIDTQRSLRTGKVQFRPQRTYEDTQVPIQRVSSGSFGAPPTPQQLAASRAQGTLTDLGSRLQGRIADRGLNTTRRGLPDFKYRSQSGNYAATYWEENPDIGLDWNRHHQIQVDPRFRADVERETPWARHLVTHELLHANSPRQFGIPMVVDDTGSRARSLEEGIAERTAMAMSGRDYGIYPQHRKLLPDIPVDDLYNMTLGELLELEREQYGVVNALATMRSGNMVRRPPR